MGIFNNDISLKLAKAVKAGFFPDVNDNELGYLQEVADDLFSGDWVLVAKGSNVNTGATTLDPFLEIISNGASAGLHLTNSVGFTGPYIFGVGKDQPGTGITLPNKANGSMVEGEQRATVTDTSPWMKVVNLSTTGPLIRLEQNVAGAAPALQLLAFNSPTDTQVLVYFGDAVGEAGVIRSLNGHIEWKRQIMIQDKDASTASYLNVTDNNGVAANTRTHTLIKKQGPEYYGYSGSVGQWWPFAVQVGGSRLKIQGGGLTSTVGTPGTLTNLIEFQNAKIGFFAASPIAQPARAGALTDSSGGTSGGATIASVTDVATAANAIATLAAKYNTLEAKLSAAGGGLGLTA